MADCEDIKSKALAPTRPMHMHSTGPGEEEGVGGLAGISNKQIWETSTGGGGRSIVADRWMPSTQSVSHLTSHSVDMLCVTLAKW
jgi:hypothetical protein